jgi:hypothetical protein
LGWLALPLKRKHWVAIKNLPSVSERDGGRSNYYNLDSKFDTPESIGGEDRLVEYFREELKSNEKELFIVVSSEVSRLGLWKLSAAQNEPGSSSSSGADAAPKSDRKGSTDSGVVELLPDLRDINVVDLDKEDMMRRQSSGVWSDFM